nr:hypothetical protein [Oscillospiraceae bacterium]
MKFRDYFSLKHILFALLLFAILIPFAIRDSNNQVKVTFDDTSVYAKSSKYSMTIRYDEIQSVFLTELTEPGEKVQDGYDDDILRAGLWKNDLWGEYHINADLDATNCVLLRLKDNRYFVISQKDNETTLEIYDTLVSKIPEA